MNAHDQLLNVCYDECINSDMFDDDVVSNKDDEELWYSFTSTYLKAPTDTNRHVDNEINTIKYYVSECSEKDENYTWASEYGEAVGEEIKKAIVDSILIWNDAYYYSYDENNNMFRNKIINIIEGSSKNDSNLIIYPISGGLPGIALTEYVDITENLDQDKSNIKNHLHYATTKITVDVAEFYDSNSKEYRENFKYYTGAHEIGHVLGLGDIDKKCSGVWHHNEVLMGYGKSNTIRVPYITYKDLAGVSITRGFHTDDDHRWMKRTNEDNSIDIICSLCNGVRYNIALDENGSTYMGEELKSFRSCVHYNGTNEEMLLVGTNGDYDFYKCLYCRKIETVKRGIELLLENNSNYVMNERLGIESAVYYKLIVEDRRYYEFSSDTYIDFELYDSNLNLIDPDYYITNNGHKLIEMLNAGTYYVVAKYNGDEGRYDAKINIDAYKSSYLSCNVNKDILINYYNNIDEYYYVNSTGPGLYKIELVARNLSGEEVELNDGSMIIKNSSTNEVIQKVNLDIYNESASSLTGANSMCFYLENSGIYNIDVDVPNNTYSRLEIRVCAVSDEDIDIFEKGIYSSFDVSLYDNISVKGDEFTKISINQITSYTLEVNYSSEDEGDVLFAVFEENYNSVTDGKYLTVLFSGELNATNNEIIYNLNLVNGTYYIGAFNLTAESVMSIFLSRNVIDCGNIQSALVPDHPSYLPSGSEVNVNGGAVGENYITEGFTRNMFIVGENIPSNSRINYNWYSSNENIATVSAYGTVLGKPVSKDEEVYIVAIYKNDPRYVFVKQVNIVNDLSTNKITVNMFDEMYLSAGSYKITLDSTCPYTLIQHYNWRIFYPDQENENFIVTVDNWGNVTSTGPGVVLLIGDYTLNSRVEVILQLRINS